MYSVPDRLIVYFIEGYVENIVLDTGVVSGQGRVQLPPFAGDKVSAVIIGSESGTNWNFSLSEE